MTDKKTCFIVGPIGEAGTPTRQLADWLLLGIFKPVLETDELGYSVKRADEDAAPGSITSALIVDLIEADLVVADLTGFNPNAFYELGIRHAIKKPTIHIIAENTRLPFDNKDQRTIFVDITDFRSIESAKLALKNAALSVASEGYKVSNPVSHALAVNALQDSADPKDQLIGEMQERLAVLESRMASSYHPVGIGSKLSRLSQAIDGQTTSSEKSFLRFLETPEGAAAFEAHNSGRSTSARLNALIAAAQDAKDSSPD
ncbi:hypothetical protein [Sphingomonas sp. NFX23]|uniref:hypothetical protein n=1 Tax=Sphingomonas sp. NFX23 TaxID=2819532 RepID=UPI003CF1CCA9